MSLRQVYQFFAAQGQQVCSDSARAFWELQRAGELIFLDIHCLMQSEAGGCDLVFAAQGPQVCSGSAWLGIDRITHVEYSDNAVTIKKHGQAAGQSCSTQWVISRRVLMVTKIHSDCIPTVIHVLKQEIQCQVLQTAQSSTSCSYHYSQNDSHTSDHNVQVKLLNQASTAAEKSVPGALGRPTRHHALTTTV